MEECRVTVAILSAARPSGRSPGSGCARYGYSSINQNNTISTADEVRLTLNFALKLY